MNYIDLFAGASGMSEGFVRSGFNPIAHIEMNHDACYTIKTRTAYHYLKLNKKLDIYHDYIAGNIGRDAFYKEIPKLLLDSVLNIVIDNNTVEDSFKVIESTLKQQKQKSIDLIIGGPPCQAYSLIGRHQVNMDNDPRTLLYKQYGEYLKKFQPKAFVFENVPGLLSAGGGKHFDNLKIYFQKIGYEIYSDILDASDYGVIQSRRRVIIVGWKKDIDLGFPSIEKCEKKEKFELRNGIDFVTHNIARPHNTRDLEIYKYAINQWNTEGVRLKYPELPERLKTHKNTKSFLDRFKVVNGKGISHTVVAHIAKDGHYYIHPDIQQCRSISVREAARIQSFPDDFYFEGSRTAAFTQIGNAVPPLMAFAIAQKIKELLC